jgi:type VI secretion system protein ImpB
MATSYQNEIPPARVNIRLSVETGNQAKNFELPLKILVLGKFRTLTDPRRLAEREKLSVHRDNFDAVMNSVDLSLSLKVPNRLDSATEQVQVDLELSSMRSFEPEEIVRQVPALGRLLAARNLMRDLGSNLMDNRTLRKELELILRDKQACKELHEELRERIPFKETNP